MTLSNAIREKIIKIANENNISIHELTLRAGLAYSTINSFLNGKCKSITLTTIIHICEGADITINEFFQDSLFDNLQDQYVPRLRKEDKIWIIE